MGEEAEEEEEEQEGDVGDEGEELVMVMRRCNDSSAVRFEFALSPLLFPSLLPRLTLYLRSAFVRR